MQLAKLSRTALRVLPKPSTLTIACGLALAASQAHAATINMGDDASFSIGAGLRMSYDSVERGAPNGTSRSNDFVIDNARLYLSGRVNKMIGATLNTERSGSGNTPDGIRIMDAYAQFEPMPEFNIWAGRMLPASDRANLDGPFYLNVWEYPFVSNYPSLAVGRDNGIQAWGKLMANKFTYVAGAFKGHNNVTGGSNQSDNLLYAGRLAYAFWDAEPAPAYYTGSTYYGSNDILTVGLAGMYQKDGVGVAAAPGNYKAYNVDVLMEKKLGAGVLTLEGAYYRYDLGALDCNSGEPGAPICPAAGPDDNVGGQVKSKAYYVTAAYLIPGKVGWGQFQPYTRYQKLSRDVSSTTKTQLDLGVNYVIKGHNARITAVYSKVKDDQLIAPLNDTDKFIIGTQLQF
jgi:hypothetical protein